MRRLESFIAPLLLLLLFACDDAPPGAGDLGERDATEDRVCRFNSDCEPGYYCKARRCDLDCRTNRDCPPDQSCQSGQCLGERSDRGLDMRVVDQRVADVAVDRSVTDVAPSVDMAVDAQPPCTERPCELGEICQRDTGLCRPFDCELDGCAAGERCEAGGCVPDVQQRVALGEGCDHAYECQSDICVGEPGFCTSLCCSERECPAGFGCIYSGGVRICAPARLSRSDFSVPAGGACGGVNNCRTGICDGQRCLDSCCEDADCQGVCELLPTGGGSARAVCDRGNLMGGIDFSPCYSDLDCRNRFCVADPNAQQGQPPGYCAPTCCTHLDCGGGLGCGQVGVGPEPFVITGCVPLERGAAVDGAECLRGEQCLSGHCVENRCVNPCCRDLNCGPQERCLPRGNGEGTLIRVCVVPDEER